MARSRVVVLGRHQPACVLRLTPHHLASLALLLCILEIAIESYMQHIVYLLVCYAGMKGYCRKGLQYKGLLDTSTV